MQSVESTDISITVYGEKYMSSRRNKGTAYHEAGHAVIACIEGVKFRYVSIVPGEDFAGLVRLYKLPEDVELGAGSTRARKQAEARIMMAFAGALATRHAFPRSRSGQASGPDLDMAFGCAMAFTGSEDEMNAYVNWLHIRTKQMVESRLVWPLIEAVANALRERQSLNASDVKDIIDQTNRRLYLEHLNGHTTTTALVDGVSTVIDLTAYLSTLFREHREEVADSR